MHSHVAPGTQVILRLQNGIFKVFEINPNAPITIPKYGTFSANLLIGRPYYTTYEVIERQEDVENEVTTSSKDKSSKKTTILRPVPAAELHAENLATDAATPTESRDETLSGNDSRESNGDAFDLVTSDGQVLIRNNRLTIDDPSRQALSMEEIEELKKASTGTSGSEIIAKIMAAHSALGEKTQYSLAKYTLRKRGKYMRRFTVLPVDIGNLVKLWSEKEQGRIMELREECLGLIGSWSNAHYHDDGGRYLVVDDACGLIVAAIAERMGLLYKDEQGDQDVDSGDDDKCKNGKDINSDAPDPMDIDDQKEDQAAGISATHLSDQPTDLKSHNSRRQRHPTLATTNTITLLHANPQPNISMLEPFGFNSNKPDPAHPLYSHLRSLTWLQLLDPSADSLYQEPALPVVETSVPLPGKGESPQAYIASLKPSKRTAYIRKKKRWERIRTIVDETRIGGFDSLIVATSIDLVGVLKHCVPLVRGGGNIVIYSPAVEPLVKVMDLYSKERRAGFVMREQARAAQNGTVKKDKKATQEEAEQDEEDFPVDPTLLLNPMLQTCRAREWQVLPMRTHPVMTSKGGSEGFLFTATKVVPLRGVKIEAKGKFGKKKKVAASEQKEEEEKGKVDADEAVNSNTGEGKELDEQDSHDPGFEARKRKATSSPNGKEVELKKLREATEETTDL